MHGIDSHAGRSKYHLTIQKPCIGHFYGSPEFGGFAARLLYLVLNSANS